MGPGGDRQSKSQRGLEHRTKLVAHGEGVTPVERQSGERPLQGWVEGGEVEVVAERSLPAPELQHGPHGGGGGSGGVIAGASQLGDLCCSVRCCHSLAETPALGVSSPLWPLKSVDCLLGGPEHPVKSRGKCPGPGRGVRSRGSPSAESECLHRQAVP